MRIARVGAYSSTAAAGLQPGDVLYSWFRPANPPGNPQADSGFFRSPWDASATLSEQTQRGTVLLWGRRGAEDRIWVLPFGEDFWQTTVILPHPGDRTPWCATAARCRHQAALAEARGDPYLAAWFLRLPMEEAGFRAAAAILARQGELLLAGIPLRLWCQRLEQLGHAPQAASCYAEAREIVHAAQPGGLHEAQVLGNLASLAVEQGDLEAADRLGLEILDIRERQTPQAVWSIAETLGFLAAVATQRGDFDTARNRLVAARGRVEGLGPTSLAGASVLAHFGDLQVARGDLPSAASAYRGAIAMQERLRPEGRNGILEELLRKLARVETARGNLLIAEGLLERSLTLAERWEGNPVILYVGLPLTLRDLATVAMRRGDHERSAALLRRAARALSVTLSRDPARTILVSANSSSTHPGRSVTMELAGIWTNLANEAERRGDALSARQFLRQALASQAREPPHSPATTERTSLQARFALLGGDLTAARELLESALAKVKKQAPTSLAAAKIRMELGGVALRRRQSLSAIVLYRQAWFLRQRLVPGSPEEAEALHALGQAEATAGFGGDGARHLCQAVDLLERQRSRVGGTPEARSMFEASTATYHRACLEGLLRLGQVDRAFHALERSRARSFLRLLADRDLRFSELPPELAAERRRLDGRYDQLQAELMQKSPGRKDPEIDRLQEELYDIRSRQEALFEEIRQASPHFASVEIPEPLDVERTLAALDSGTALLSYSVGETKTFLFVLRPGETPAFSVIVLPVGETGLREKVGAFHNLLRNGRTDVRALDAQARRLYSLLLRPAERYIAGAERLLISPDGPLHTLPFAALRRKEQYLVEWKPVHSVLSATVYAEITKSRPEARDPGTMRLVAFGDPLYPATPERLADLEVRDAARGHDFPPLPATRGEVEGVASLFPQAEVFLGAEATEDRAKEIGPQAQLLHFACHGFLNDRFPLNSGLALTVPDPPAEGQDNGLLQAWEIFEGVRLDADLVTLSACNTALGPEMGGEGLVGLTRAFQYAGARSVLASFWSVSDASTGELMKRFYTHLRAGKTKDEALRAAQSELIHKNDALSHPYHWAAFQLFGDWQ